MDQIGYNLNVDSDTESEHSVTETANENESYVLTILSDEDDQVNDETEVGYDEDDNNRYASSYEKTESSDSEINNDGFVKMETENIDKYVSPFMKKENDLDNGFIKTESEKTFTQKDTLDTENLYNFLETLNESSNKKLNSHESETLDKGVDLVLHDLDNFMSETEQEEVNIEIV